MSIDKINFVEKEVVSIAQVNTSRKFRFLSTAVGVVLIILTAATVGISIYLTNKLNQAVAVQNNLIAELSSAENKKKEMLFFLIRDRLTKIKTTEKNKITEYEKLLKIQEISKTLTVKDFSLRGNVCTIVIEAGDYDKIDVFLNNLDKYGIEAKSVVVTQTEYKENKYSAKVRFVFL